MKIVLIGIQGAGKSTQGNLLSEMYDIPYLSSGHIFRQMARKKNKTGRWLKETINAGILVSDDMVTKIVNEYLDRDIYEDGFIIDGYPRTVAQAEDFTTGEEKVIFIDVSDKEALWRISGRVSTREDETLKAIRKRIQLFHEKTAPVIDFYKKRGQLISINGEQAVTKVFDDIIKALDVDKE